MICIALGNLSFEECLEAVNTLEFAEIRLDLLDLSQEEIHTLFSRHPQLIATCRPGKYADEDERKQILLHAIASGAAYVDVEVEAGDDFKDEVITAARASGCQTIISYHNFEKTPERAELDHIVNWCAELKPDIVKIACMAHSNRDNARLLGLLDTDKCLLILGMGEQGKITRIVSPLLGSFCTFGAYTLDKATAPGQLPKTELERLMHQIEKA